MIIFLGEIKKVISLCRYLGKSKKKPQWFISADEVKKPGGSQCGNY